MSALHRILVANDDPVFFEALASRLQAAGLQVAGAFDSLHALNAALRYTPDAILLDLKVPDATGLALLRRLRSSAQTATIPVLVLTGSTDPSLPREAASSGATVLLRKPVSVDEIYDTLRWACGAA